jgi:hypothetical protein
LKKEFLNIIACGACVLASKYKGMQWEK